MPRECDCRGGCGSAQSGISRRDFVGILGLGAIGAGVRWEEWVSAQTERGKLESWMADLKKQLPRRRYRSERNTDARMPLGGIGTGNFDIGVDGRFTTWQLFNTLRDGHVPFFFAVYDGARARLLQTVGGPDWPRISAIELTGDYPIAKLKYEDPSLAVGLGLTAFTPFAPLDTDFSSMPLACFLFKVDNPSAVEREVSVGAFMQNPVGYDAVGVPVSFNSIGFNAVDEHMSNTHPNFGGNRNRIYKDGNLAGIGMEAIGGIPSLSEPVTLFTNLSITALNTPYNDRPQELTVLPLDRLSDRKKGRFTRTVIWIDDARANLPAAHLRHARDAVRDGATLLFSGSSQPLLDLYGKLTNGKSLDTATLKPDILFEDFETNYKAWKIEGTAFGARPAGGTLANQQRVSGFLGKGLVNSYLNGDDTIGKMTSEPFRIDRAFIRFLVGGGSHAETQIRLIVNGRAVRATSGRDNELLLPASWDVSEFLGQSAHIEIVDESVGPWGHINIDQIEFSDLPGSVEIMSILQELLPIRLSGAKTSPANPDEIELNGVELLSGAKQTGSDFSIPFGKGRTVLTARAIIRASELEMVGSRQRAYSVICGYAGVRYTPPSSVPETSPGFGALFLGTTGDRPTMKAQFTDWGEAWKLFSGQGKFDSPTETKNTRPALPQNTLNCALASTVKVPAGGSVEIPFFLAWRYPNKYSPGGAPMGNHYAVKWKSPRDVARTAARTLEKLRGRTELFQSAFNDSTLPSWLLDCISSQLSTIRHIGVVFRIANGDVYGWEGSNGCCQPTCTHVWGYEQSLSYMFPDLEREMRRIDFFHQQNLDGGINNRTEVPSPNRPTGERPFADGHASCVLKAYREGLNCVDDSFLNDFWPPAKRAVEYLIGRDAATSGGAPNGILEDDQWNTYDQALHGVTTFISGYYLAALRAGEEWAKRVGDSQSAAKFRDIFISGRQRLIDLCWNGEYFQQHLPGYEKMPGEVGPGCMSDQLIGQWWCHELGLGYLFPEVMVRSALKSIYKYNWIPDLTNWRHSPRAFAGAGDKGLIICTWPKGGRPDHVMLYSDEVWTGIEYQVAAHMIYEGLMDEGLAIIKGARDRYDGVPRAPIPRNPWNEIECGGHYARAMSSWSILRAMGGFRFDGPAQELTLRPAVRKRDFRSFMAAPEAWGSVEQLYKDQTAVTRITLAEGRLSLKRINVHALRSDTHGSVEVQGRPVAAEFRISGDVAQYHLSKPLTLRSGQTVTISQR